MLNIWQLLRILWAVTMGLFPGLISVLLPKCSCLSVHPALYRKVAEQTDSTGACRTVCNIQRPTSSVPKQGAPSASWVAGKLRVMAGSPLESAVEKADAVY